MKMFVFRAYARLDPQFIYLDTTLENDLVLVEDGSVFRPIRFVICFIG